MSMNKKYTVHVQKVHFAKTIYLAILHRSSLICGMWHMCVYTVYVLMLHVTQNERNQFN
jgi:hypothetical protein